MPIRFNASGDFLSITSGEIDCNAPYTWMTNLNIVTLPGADANIMGMDGNTLFELVQVDSSNRLALYVFDSGAPVTGSTLVAGRDYNIAVVRESVASCKIYLDGVLNISSTFNVTGRDNSDYDMFMAAITAGNWPLDCRIATVKAWTKAKSNAEIWYESKFVRPMDTSGLYGFWPAFPGTTERVRDCGGTGHNWTANGTLTDESTPPSIPYYRSSLAWLNDSAAAAASLVFDDRRVRFQNLLAR